MSYRLEYSPSAQQRLLDLDIWLQETILDEIDRIADDPSSLLSSAHSRVFVHDFESVRGGLRHIVFLTLRRNDATETLVVEAIGYVVKAVNL